MWISQQNPVGYVFFNKPPSYIKILWQKMVTFKLSTHRNGLVIYLGMYVALPWQQILSDIDFVPAAAAAVYLTHH